MKIYKKRYILSFIIICAIYLITAYNSHGYYHADEHFQIMEFAGLKANFNTANDLTWEYHAKIRPTIQPVICSFILNSLTVLNIVDPFKQAFVLRLISMMLALLIIGGFYKTTSGAIKSPGLKFMYFLFSFLLWFIPFLSVRFSSENWSGLMFLLSLTLYNIHSKFNYKYLLIGVSLGLGFLFRFQIAFAYIGFILWIIFIQKVNIFSIIKLSLGFLFILMLGVLTDSWFYNEFVFTPWNYFNINVIEDVASKFGTPAWYYYISEIFVSTGYPIGGLIVLSVFILLVLNPKNMYNWCLLFFVFFHSILPHKELRFIFPMAYLIPVILVNAYIEGVKYVNNEKVIHVLNFILIIGMTGPNLTGLVAFSQKSAFNGRMKIANYIHKKYSEENVNLIAGPYANPFNPWGTNANFYKHNNIIHKNILKMDELDNSFIDSNRINLFTIRHFELHNERYISKLHEMGFKKELDGVPVWIQETGEYFNISDKRKYVVLYKYYGNNFP